MKKNCMIHRVVKRLMYDKGLSAVDLSKKTGLDRSTIYRTVGDSGNTTIRNMATIASALDMDLSAVVRQAEILEKELTEG